jgi:hypothetical protein
MVEELLPAALVVLVVNGQERRREDEIFSTARH